MYPFEFDQPHDLALIRVKKVPRKLIKHLGQWYQGLGRIELRATWTSPDDESHTDPEVLVGVASDVEPGTIAGSCPALTPEEIAMFVTHIADGFIRDQVHGGQLDEDEGVVKFLLSGQIISIGHSGEPKQTVLHCSFQRSVEDVAAEDEEDDDEDEEEEEGEEGEGEGDEEDDDDDEEEDDEEEEEGEEGEGEGDEEKPKKRPKKSNRERHQARKARERMSPQRFRHAQKERDRLVAEREAGVRLRAGSGLSLADRMSRRLEMGRPAPSSHPPRIMSEHAETELVSLMREFKQILGIQADANRNERDSLNEERRQLWDEMRRSMEEVRINYGHLHTVDMETIRESNESRRVSQTTIADMMKYQRQIAADGWAAWRQGMMLQQSALHTTVNHEKAILELRAEQTSRDHEHELREAKRTVEKPKGPGFMGGLKEIIEVATPLILGLRAGERGDLDGKEEGLIETMRIVTEKRKKMRDEADGEDGEEEDEESGDEEGEEVEVTPEPKRVTLPTKPQPRRARADAPPVTIEPAVEMSPAEDPPIAQMSLPDGENFEEFESRSPVVARLRLLIIWLTAGQNEQIAALLGPAWVTVVKAAASNSDKEAILSLISLRSKLKDKTIEGRMKAILSDRQGELFDDIKKTIRKKLGGG